MSKLGKLSKNFGLLTIGSFSSKLLTFLLVPLYTAVLTTAEYGVVDIINTTVSLIYPLAILVISEAVIRFCLDNTSDKNQVWTIGIGITFLGNLVMLLISPVILFTSFKDYYIFFVLQCMMMSFYQTISQFVKGLDKVKVYAIGGIINTIVVISLNIILLLFIKMGLIGYLIAMVSGHFISIIYFFISLKLWRYFIRLKNIDKSLLKKMLNYSVPMIPNSISWWISDSSDKYIVKYFCGLAVNGVYAIAYKIPTLLSTITNLFIGAWQISAFEDFNSKESRAFFSNITNEFVKLNLLVASGLIFMTKPIAKIMFVAEFFEAWRFTPVLILAFVFSTSASFIGTVYTAAKKTKMLFYSTLVAAVANIIFDIILTPQIGAMGAAIATALSYAAICVIRFVDSRKIMKLDLDWKCIFLSLALVIIQIFIILMDSLASFIMCGMVMLIIIFLNRAMFVKMIKMVVSKIKK